MPCETTGFARSPADSACGRCRHRHRGRELTPEHQAVDSRQVRSRRVNMLRSTRSTKTAVSNAPGRGRRVAGVNADRVVAVFSGSRSAHEPSRSLVQPISSHPSAVRRTGRRSRRDVYSSSRRTPWGRCTRANGSSLSRAPTARAARDLGARPKVARRRADAVHVRHASPHLRAVLVAEAVGTRPLSSIEECNSNGGNYVRTAAPREAPTTR